MKKILIITIILLLNISNTFASKYILTGKDRLIVNKVSSKIKNLIKKQSPDYKKIIENKINEIQEQNNSNDKIFAIFGEIKKNINIKESNLEYIEYYNKFDLDFEKIKNSWLDWQNNERNSLGRNLYSYDDRLIKTAFEWSNIQKQLGTSTHKRNLGDSYYNYQKIEKWFNERGVKCAISGGMTSTESIGRNSYYCSDGDCNKELLGGLKKVFNMYMKEKGLKYPNNLHYRSIINNNLSKIGIGIAIKESKNKNYYNFFITIHYCTKFID